MKKDLDVVILSKNKYIGKINLLLDQQVKFQVYA